MDGQNGGQGGQKSLKMTAIDLFQVHRAHLRQDALPLQHERHQPVSADLMRSDGQAVGRDGRARRS